jgi:iron complex transport system ATP-binding protein
MPRVVPGLPRSILCRMKRSPFIEIERVTVFRGDVCALQNFSLTVESGEHLAILGPNGAGKSTFLKLLAGEIHPVPNDTTHIRLFGDERWNVWDVRKQLGFVSHDLQHHYMDHVLGLKVVLSGFYASIGIYGHQEFSYAQLARASEIMGEFGVGHLKERRFADMSTGEQRRCLLARALVHNPTVLVLDEPTSGLDLSACFQYLDLVRRSMRQDKTVLLVTHHIHEIPPEVERVMMLQAGTVLRDGKKQDVLTDANLSHLFGRPMMLVTAHGWYQALPGS